MKNGGSGASRGWPEAKELKEGARRLGGRESGAGGVRMGEGEGESLLVPARGNVPDGARGMLEDVEGGVAMEPFAPAAAAVGAHDDGAGAMFAGLVQDHFDGRAGADDGFGGEARGDGGGEGAEAGFGQTEGGGRGRGGWGR